MFIYAEAESLWISKPRQIAVKEKQVAGNFPGWLVSHSGAKSCLICSLQIWVSPDFLIRNKLQLKRELLSEISWRWMWHSAIVWRLYSADQYLRYPILDYSSAHISWKLSKWAEYVGGVGRDGQGMPVSWHIVNVFGLTLKIYSFEIHTIILCISLKNPVCFAWYRSRGQMGICGLCFHWLAMWRKAQCALSLFPCIQTMLFTWLFRMRHKKL